MIMKTSLTKIGNSKGIIIPVHLLKQCGLMGEVSLEVKDEALIISKPRRPREGWAKAFTKAGAEAEKLLLNDFGNDFDQDEWSW